MILDWGDFAHLSPEDIWAVPGDCVLAVPAPSRASFSPAVTGLLKSAQASGSVSPAVERAYKVSEVAARAQQLQLPTLEHRLNSCGTRA